MKYGRGFGKYICWAIGIAMNTAPITAFAGMTIPPTADCGPFERQNHRLAYCYGSLRGFQQDPDPQAYAQFGVSLSMDIANVASSPGTATGHFFVAALGGKTFFCKLPQKLSQALALGLSPDDYFYVEMNTDKGVCTALTLYKSSAYPAHLDVPQTE